MAVLTITLFVNLGTCHEQKIGYSESYFGFSLKNFIVSFLFFLCSGN